MKKILLLSIVLLFLNGCRYIVTKDEHLDAKESKELEIPAGMDKPNTTSELEVPKAKNQDSLDDVVKIPPPEMPIRTKQSRNGDARIENREGYPVLSVKTGREFMWQALNDLHIINWSTTNTNQDDCVINLHYTDIDAQERDNAGFFKKMFTRESLYSDYSGEYKLTCEKKGSVMQVTFAKNDGTKAKSFLADHVMTALFNKFQ